MPAPRRKRRLVTPAEKAPPRRQGKRCHLPRQARCSSTASVTAPAGQAPPLRHGKSRLADRTSAVTLAGSASPLRHSKHRYYRTASPTTPTEQAPPRRQGTCRYFGRKRCHSDWARPLLRQGKRRHSNRASPPLRHGTLRHSGRVSVTAQAGLAPPLRQDKPAVSSGQTSPRRQGKRRHSDGASSVTPAEQACCFGRANVVTSTELAPSLREGTAAATTRQTRRADKECPLLRQDKPTTPTGQAPSLQQGQRHRSGTASPATPTGSTSPLRHGKRRHSDGASAITPTGQAPPLQQNKPRLSDRASPPFRQYKHRRAAGHAPSLWQGQRLHSDTASAAAPCPLPWQTPSPFPPRGGSPTENTAHPPSQRGGCARVSRSRDWAYCAGCSAALPASSAMGMRTAERYVPSGP